MGGHVCRPETLVEVTDLASLQTCAGEPGLYRPSQSADAVQATRKLGATSALAGLCCDAWIQSQYDRGPRDLSIP